MRRVALTTGNNSSASNWQCLRARDYNQVNQTTECKEQQQRLFGYPTNILWLVADEKWALVWRPNTARGQTVVHNYSQIQEAFQADIEQKMVPTLLGKSFDSTWRCTATLQRAFRHCWQAWESRATKWESSFDPDWNWEEATKMGEGWPV